MNNKTTSDGETSRRDFLKTSSTAAVASAATLSLISRGTAYGQNSDTIRVGLVGCGGRGTGAANQDLSADDNVKLTAVADVFPDAVDRAVNGLKKRHEKKVDVPHQFVGLDAYQKLIDSGVDLVVLATPPGFRPVHFRRRCFTCSGMKPSRFWNNHGSNPGLGPAVDLFNKAYHCKRSYMLSCGTILHDLIDSND